MTESKPEEKIESKKEEKVESKVSENSSKTENKTTENKETENKTTENKTTENKSNRKRKWDDQGSSSDGLVTPPNPAITNSKSSENDSKDPNAIAQVAAQAAKIREMLQAKGIPIRNSSPSVIANPINNAQTTSTEASEASKAKEKALKGEFCKDIEINDLRNRYNLIKASTLAKLQEETGAGIITRGKYYSNKALATEKDPPLYLHVAAATQEILDNALAKIQEIIDSKPITLVSTPENNSVFPKPTINNRYHQEKIFIGIDDRSFNAKVKLIGIQGRNVKHIHNATGAKIQLKGKGSGFIEPTSGQEAFEPMFFQISSVTKEGLEKAKQLVEDLINTVKGEYEKFKQYRANRPNNPKPYNAYHQGYVPYASNPLPPGMYSAPGYPPYNGYSGYAPPPPPPMGADATSVSSSSTPSSTIPLTQPPPPPLPYPQSSAASAANPSVVPMPPLPSAGQIPPTPPPSSTTTSAPSYYQPQQPQQQNRYSYYGAPAVPPPPPTAASYNPYYYYPPPQHQQPPPPPLPSNPPPVSGTTDTSSASASSSTPYQPGNPTTKY